jgi:hypothetical protein
MNDRDFDAGIAEAIIQGRILRIPTLRDMASFGGVLPDDKLWRSMEPRWEAHNELSSEELQKRCGLGQ